MQPRKSQSGLTLVGFIIVAAPVSVALLIAFRVTPAYIEYFTVEKVLRQTLNQASDGATIAQLRRDYDLKASADYIDSVRGSDLDFQKSGNELILSASWIRQLHLVGNVSLLLEFEASAKK